MTETQFDAYIPYHPKDEEIVSYCIQTLRKYCKGLRTIFCISESDPGLDDVEWIPESRFPFTKQDIYLTLGCQPSRAGWYFQQLVKLYCWRILGTQLCSNVLWLDSDVMFCKSIEFFESNGTILLDWNNSPYEPYYLYISRVLGTTYTYKDEWKSGINDHMMIRTDHLESLLQTIESFSTLSLPAWRILLEAVDKTQANLSGMSEFELYYYYCLTNYPRMYKQRQLKKLWTLNLHDAKSGLYDMAIFHSWLRDDS